MDYQDFEIRIGAGIANKYRVVVSSPGGRASALMHFPYAKSELNMFQGSVLRSRDTDVSTNIPWATLSAEEFGKGLFNALIVDDVRDCYVNSKYIARSKNMGLRIRLIIDAGAPELTIVPWEFLRDDGKFLSLDSASPISRYLEIAEPPEPLSIELPLRILGMVVSPTDLAPLNIDTEQQKINESIKDLAKKGLIEWKWVNGQTWRDLQRAMHTGNGPWHIFHFIGHGGFNKHKDEGFLAFADDHGKTHKLPASDLGYLIDNHSSLRLVILNACSGAKGSDSDIFSSTSSVLSRIGIPAVIAMQYKISDRAAIEFAYTFYEYLAKGDPVDTALTEARVAIKIKGSESHEWGTPVLHLRSPDGRLFSTSSGQNISSIVITPVHANLISGQHFQLTAQAYDAQGKELVSPDLIWTSEDTDVILIDPNSGMATAKIPGKTKVKARTGDAESCIELEVHIASLSINPVENHILFAGSEIRLKATALDSNNKRIENVEMIWASQDPRIASIDSKTGLVQARLPGKTFITVQSGEFKDSMELEVKLASISIDPKTTNTLKAGQQVRFKAQALGSHAKIISGVPFSWSSKDKTIASVEETTGLVEARNPGKTTVTVRYGNLIDHAEIEVTVAAISMDHANASFVKLDRSVSLKAYALDMHNKRLSDVGLVWESSNVGIASVHPLTGLVSGLMTGVVTITACYGQVRASSEMVVQSVNHPSQIKTTGDRADQILMEVAFDQELRKRSGAKKVKVCLELASTSSGWWKGLGLGSNRPTLESERKEGIQSVVIPAQSLEVYYWKAKGFGVHTSVGSETIDFSRFGGYTVTFKWLKD